MDEQQKQRIKRWIEALRSGEYQQAQDALRVLDEFDEDEGSYCYCCLGVACQISGLGDWNDRDQYRDGKGLADCYLPPEVADYFGLTHEEQHTLAEMNDGGSDFGTIADFIEQKILN